MPPKKKVKSDSGAPRAAKWEYQGDDGAWVEYGEVDVTTIEKAHATGTPVLTTTDLSFNKGHGSKYSFDFSALTQHNADSGKVRKIRRVAPPGVWEWLDDFGIFAQFYDEDQSLIEKAFVATGVGKEFKTKALTFNVGFDSPYSFLFKTEGPAPGEVSAVQTNEDSGKTRQVRRLAGAPTAWDTSAGYGIKGAEAPPTPTTAVDSVFPVYWSAPKGKADGVDRVPVPEGSKEYKEVVAHFNKTIKTKKVVIHSVTRLQNYMLYKFYAMTREHVATRNAGDPTEMLLWHGARLRANMDAIIGFGFDMRVANSGSCGLGIYFAVNAQYSNCGYVLQNPDKSKEMFLCRVAVGSHTQGAGGLRRPPPLVASKPTGDLYDSVTNGKPPIMHVVFNNWQAYPEYVVHYTAT